jgi:CO/xanthine dehydrogenase Mo-binding subunit
VERLLETAARQLKVDPAELRRKNFITTFPHQTPVIMAYDIGDFGASLDAAMKAIDYAGFPARKAKAKSEGKLRGLGLSCYIEACGIAPSKAVGSLGAGVGLWESAEVRVNPDRTATAKAMKRPSASWSQKGSAFPSARSRSSMATPTRCSSAWAPMDRVRPPSV